jgi:hypothetical protein
MRPHIFETYEDLEKYLRQFVNFHGDPAPYDFVGAFHLFLAILDSLGRHHLDADVESLKECGVTLSREQWAFIEKLRLLEQ